VREKRVGEAGVAEWQDPYAVGGVFEAGKPDLNLVVSRTWSIYTRQWAWFAATGVAVSTIQGAMAYASGGLMLLLGMAILVPTNLSLYVLTDIVARGETPTIDRLLVGFKNPQAWLLGILETLILVAALIAFVIPGLILALALGWSVPLLARRQMGAAEAMRRSMRLTMERLGFSLGMVLLAWFLHSLGSSTMILGGLTLPLLAIARCIAIEMIEPRRVEVV
jgi:hypothetical protein